jgi:hypothetical protein
VLRVEAARRAVDRLAVALRPPAEVPAALRELVFAVVAGVDRPEFLVSAMVQLTPLKSYVDSSSVAARSSNTCL